MATPAAGAAVGTPMTGMGTPGAGAAVGTPGAQAAGQVRIMQSIALQNPTTVPIDLSGWRLRIGDTSVTLPSGARAAPGETVVIHFGQGETRGNDVYLGAQAQELASELRPGSRVVLENPQGTVVTEMALPA